MISTIGIHEVRGYARQFSSIGIKPELAEIFQTEAFAASTTGGVGFADARRRHRPAPRRSCAATRRARSRRRRSASTPRSTRRRSPPPTAPPATRTTRRRCASSSRRARSRCATSCACAPIGEAINPASVDPGVGHHDYPIVISLDELRLAVRARVPLLRRGGEGDQHPLHQRRGRRDPRHVRPLPQVARPAGRLGPVRGLGGDAQRLLRRRDQDRPGREAGRGRAICPARRSPRRSPRRATRRRAPT